MKNIKNNLPIKCYQIILYISFVLFSLQLIGQIDLVQYEKDFGKGLTTLKNKIDISFIYNEKTQSYTAKATYQIQRLQIANNDANGLVQIPFNEFQDLKLLKARYFKIDSLGKKILVENVKVKYSDEKDYFIKNIFYSDLKVKQFKCAVNLPESYVVSYSYEIVYKDLKFLNSFFFQYADEAVQAVEISIKKNPNITFSVYEFNNEFIKKTEDDTYIKYEANNLVRYKPNSKSVNSSYYLPHIIVSVSEVKNKNKTTEILNSTQNLYDWYQTLIKQLNTDENLINELASSIVGYSKSDDEKVNKIFNWVQNNIQYVAFENGIAGFKPDEAQNVANLKYGDCKGIANLLVNLLQSLGYNAKHAWIGTRSKNYDYTLPSLVVDNHMICVLNLNDNIYFLDGTSKSASWKKPPPHLEGKQVLVGNNETYQILKINKSTPENNSIDITGVLDLSQRQAKIELNIKLSGHFKVDFIGANKYMSANTNNYLPYYFIYDYLDGVNVDKISALSITEDNITYKVSGNYMNLAKDEIGTVVFPFLNILAYDKLSNDMPPVYIDYPQTINVKLQIINKGKLTNSLFKKQEIGNEKFNANFFTEKVGNVFFVHQKLKLNLLHSPLKNHVKWNEFISKVKAFNNYPLTYE